MGWSSDLVSGADGFDPRLAQVTLGSLFGRFGVTFFREFWDVSGNGLGKCSDGFGKVWEKMSDEVEISTFSTTKI